jgi:hypothetical protein
MVKKNHKDDSSDNDSDSDKKRIKKLKAKKDKKKKKEKGITININVSKSGKRGRPKKNLLTSHNPANIKPLSHITPMNVGTPNDKNDAKVIEKLNDATQSIQREMRESNKIFLNNQLHNEKELSLIKDTGKKAIEDIYSVIHHHKKLENGPIYEQHPAVKEYKKPGPKPKPKLISVKKSSPMKTRSKSKNVLFEDEIVIPSAGSITPSVDIDEMNDEQILKDVIAEEKRLQALQTQKQKAGRKPGSKNKSTIAKEQAALHDANKEIQHRGLEAGGGGILTGDDNSNLISSINEIDANLRSTLTGLTPSTKKTFKSTFKGTSPGINLLDKTP